MFVFVWRECFWLMWCGDFVSRRENGTISPCALKKTRRRSLSLSLSKRQTDHMSLFAFKETARLYIYIYAPSQREGDCISLVAPQRDKEAIYLYLLSQRE